MSERESFLERWSRRKLEIEEKSRSGDADADAKPAGETRAEEAMAAGAEPAAARAAAPTDGVGTAEPEFDFLSQLPSIESITATIRPFLRPGVPSELTHAALRRVWSVDPNIRDYIGLAENQWDFATGDIPGFGALELTEDLRKIVAEIVGGGPPTPAERTPAPEAASDGKAAEAESQPAKAIAESPAAAGPSARPTATTLEIRRSAEQVNAIDDKSIVQSNSIDVAARQDETQRNESKPMQRGHGGALPR
jgi:hypothetical protein